MSDLTKIISPTQGLVGYLHEIEYSEPDSFLVFQLPRATIMLSETYVRHALDSVKDALPAGRKALVVGCDVNIYELAGADALVLKLKGLI